MRFLINGCKKKVMGARIVCLAMAVLMLLCSCGQDAATTTKKKKKKIIVVKRPESSDVQGGTSDTDDTSISDAVTRDENEDDDEGDDLTADPIVDRSNRKSSVPSQYSKLVWSDEFNGTELDSSKWIFEDPYRTANDDYIYSTDTKTGTKYVHVKNGKYTVLGSRYFDPYNPQYTYIMTPTMSTSNSMRFRYGYVEMCAKLPFCSAAWPSFWTRGENNDTDAMAEVDIYECFGSKDTIVPALHKWYNKESQEKKGYPRHTQIGSSAKQEYTFNDSRNLKNEYHVYGFEWTDTYMAMSVDGEEYNRFSITDDANYDGYGDMSPFRQPLWLLIGGGAITPYVFEENGWLANGGLSAAGLDADFPYEMSVDWIRVYQNPNQAGNTFSTDSSTFRKNKP